MADIFYSYPLNESKHKNIDFEIKNIKESTE